MEIERELDASHPEIFVDRNRCVLCGRCVRASQELATAAVRDGTVALAEREAQEERTASRSARTATQLGRGGGANQFGPGGVFPGLSGSTYVVTTTTDEVGDFVSREVRPGGRA